MQHDRDVISCGNAHVKFEQMSNAVDYYTFSQQFHLIPPQQLALQCGYRQFDMRCKAST